LQLEFLPGKVESYRPINHIADVNHNSSSFAPQTRGGYPILTGFFLNVEFVSKQRISSELLKLRSVTRVHNLIPHPEPGCTLTITSSERTAFVLQPIHRPYTLYTISPKNNVVKMGSVNVSVDSGFVVRWSSLDPGLYYVENLEM
ncbi:15942_t:CDS:2, partial [Dentiscutata erythropus]